jgi:hypothetical protein
MFQDSKAIIDDMVMYICAPTIAAHLTLNMAPLHSENSQYPNVFNDQPSESIEPRPRAQPLHNSNHPKL